MVGTCQLFRKYCLFKIIPCYLSTHWHTVCN